MNSSHFFKPKFLELHAAFCMKRYSNGAMPMICFQKTPSKQPAIFWDQWGWHALVFFHFFDPSPCIRMSGLEGLEWGWGSGYQCVYMMIHITDLIHKSWSRPRMLGNRNKRSERTRENWQNAFLQLFPEILRLFLKILYIKLSWKVEIILLRKYDMIYLT